MKYIAIQYSAVHVPLTCRVMQYSVCAIPYSKLLLKCRASAVHCRTAQLVQNQYQCNALSSKNVQCSISVMQYIAIQYSAVAVKYRAKQKCAAQYKCNAVHRTTVQYSVAMLCSTVPVPVQYIVVK